MRTAYYPGCTLKFKARNLESSALASLEALGVAVAEMERWNCCGAVYSLSDDDLIHLLAPVRDLIRVKDMGYNKVMTICSMCYNTLARANKLMKEDDIKRKTINTFMEEETDYHGEVEVKHLLPFLKEEVGWDKIRTAVKNPLTGLKLAPYLGCTLTRPREAAIETGIFREFIEALGAECVDFDAEERCCGSYQTVSHPEAALETSADILLSAKMQGANAMIVSCPLCDYNLGRKQKEALKLRGNDSAMPIFYFTQLLAIALRLDEKVCKFEYNEAEAVKFLRETGKIAS